MDFFDRCELEDFVFFNRSSNRIYLEAHSLDSNLSLFFSFVERVHSVEIDNVSLMSFESLDEAEFDDFTDDESDIEIDFPLIKRQRQ